MEARITAGLVARPGDALGDPARSRSLDRETRPDPVAVAVGAHQGGAEPGAVRLDLVAEQARAVGVEGDRQVAPTVVAVVQAAASTRIGRRRRGEIIGGTGGRSYRLSERVPRLDGRAAGAADSFDRRCSSG